MKELVGANTALRAEIASSQEKQLSGSASLSEVFLRAPVNRRLLTILCTPVTYSLGNWSPRVWLPASGFSVWDLKGSVSV